MENEGVNLLSSYTMLGLVLALAARSPAQDGADGADGAKGTPAQEDGIPAIAKPAQQDKREKQDETIASLRRAIGLDPDDAKAHYTLGIALGKEGKLDEAVASYRRALIWIGTLLYGQPL